MIDLCFLGTGGSIPLPNRALSSLYVRVSGKGMLIDVGEGTQIEIMRLGWGFRCIESLLITHFHADHCSGLPGFLLAQAKTGRTEPLHIYGPVGLRRVVDALRVIAPQLPYPIELHELGGEVNEFDTAGLHACAFPLDHGIPCLGFAFRLDRLPPFLPEKAAALNVPMKLWRVLQKGTPVEVDGRTIEPRDVQGDARQGISFLFATDTRPVPDIVRFGADTNLMILEGMYGEEEKYPLAVKNHHMLYRESAALAREAGAKRLILTHFSTSMEEPEISLPSATDIFPETVCAADGMTLTLHYPE
ncbi:MAG: ribonuclease Z [Clostridia bacterium]|nr:ribonuclease Z [Clostridia bacterium]